MPIVLPSEQGGNPLSLAQAEALFSSFYRASVSVTINGSGAIAISGSARYKVLPFSGITGTITSITLTGETVEGTYIQLRPETVGHTIILTHAGNLHLANAQNAVLTTIYSTIWLRHYGSNVWAQEGAVTYTA